MSKLNYVPYYPILREDWGRGEGEEGFLAFSTQLKHDNS